MIKSIITSIIGICVFLTTTSLWALTYPVVDTAQTNCYDNHRIIKCPDLGKPFYGQDAQYYHQPIQYKDNKDGTITDLTTGLMWAKARGEKMTWEEAVNGAATYHVAVYNDWRMPTIKELYSLIHFSGGYTPKGQSIPYIYTHLFEFKYGDPQKGEREIDCQDWSSTPYAGTTMNNEKSVFGVNFADGRIKAYPKRNRQEEKKMYVRYVRGNPNYGKNRFIDNQNGTVTDEATGLMWSKKDSGAGMDWETALKWVEDMNTSQYLGYNDWKMPNAKELQSIVDYTKAPLATDPSRRGPAINAIFNISTLKDGKYPFFWTNTTHLDGPQNRKGTAAVYIAFGKATGWMGKPSHKRLTPQKPLPYPEKPLQPKIEKKLMDVHGAGAQRSDPKVGNPADYPEGRGPQGDVIRINNYVRLVRVMK